MSISIRRKVYELLNAKLSLPIPRRIFDDLYGVYASDAPVSGPEEAAKAIAEDLWGNVEFGDVLRGELAEFDEDSKRRLGLREQQHPPDSRTVAEEVRYDPLDRAKIKALSEYYAKLAAEHEGVQYFRQVVLGDYAHRKLEWEQDLEVALDGAPGYPGVVGDERAEARSRYAKEQPLPQDRLLTDEEAYELLESHAAKYMSVRQFKEWHIPIIGHKAYMGWPAGAFGKLELGEGYQEAVILTFEHSGETYALRASRPEIHMDGFRLMAGKKVPSFPAHRRIAKECDPTLRYMAAHPEIAKQLGWKIKPEDAERLEKIRQLRQDNKQVRPTCREHRVEFERTLRYWDSRKKDEDAKDIDRRVSPRIIEHVRRMRKARNAKGPSPKVQKVWPGSLLDDLSCIAEELAERYHWDEGDAVWFVLTGARPWIGAINASTKTISAPAGNVQMDLRILPWIERSTLERLYHGIQQRLYGRHRRPDLRTIEVFAFVTAEAGVAPKEWKSLMEIWNEEHEDVFGNLDSFKSCYRRGKRYVLGPGQRIAQGAGKLCH